MRTLATLRRQALQLGRLTADLFRQFPADIARILAAAAASLACQVVALLGLYAYLKALELNQSLLGLQARESAPLFAIIVARICRLRRCVGSRSPYRRRRTAGK